MNPTANATKVTVKWLTRDAEKIASIRRYFGLPDYTTLNGWTPGEIAEDKMATFEETARRGFISYRLTEWERVGETYSWK